MATVPTELLARVRQATPEQQEAIWRFLDAGVPLPGSAAAAPETGGVARCPSMADCARRVVLGGHTRCGERGLACVVATKGSGVSREEREGGEGKCEVQGTQPRVLSPRGLEEVVVKAVEAMATAAARIEGKVDVVLKKYQEVATAKERLEKMLADGLFAFTRRVDPASFKVLCAILAEGDVAKASRTLGMPDGSIRTLMRRWRGMGKPYQVMLDLVRWRKAVGGKETVALSDNVLLGQTKSSDHPALAADLLEKVAEMTGDNWREKAEELEQMLR